MALHVPIATAPEWRGDIGTPSAWAGASSATITMSGRYTGSENKTITFTVDDAGDLGSSLRTIDWSDGEGNEGRLSVGTGYTAGVDALALLDGVLVTFSIGGGADLVTTDTATVALTAHRRLPADAQYLSGRGEPCSVYVERISRVDLDGYFPSEYADTVRVERERQLNPELSLDYHDGDTLAVALALEGLRHEVCIGEDYDASTVLLWRHGTEPVIGPVGTFTRAAAVAGYVHPVTGRVTQADANEMRYGAGPVGKALVIDTDAGMANKLAQFHGENDGTTVWSVSGSATVDWDGGATPILDQSENGWPEEYLGGCERAYIPSADYIHSTDFAVTAAYSHACSVWLRGRGVVTFRFRSGVGAASNVTAAEQITLTPTWTLYELTGTQTGVGHDTGDLQIVGDEDATVYIGPYQCEPGPGATYSWGTDIGVSRSVEALTFPVSIPADSGTLGFWFYVPADITAGQSFDLIDAGGVAGSERFRITYLDPASITLELTAAAGTDAAYISGDIAGAWHHLAVTWERGSAGKAQAIIYLDGVAVDTEPDADWLGYFGSSVIVGGTGSREASIKELRIDNVAQSAAEILRWYERFTDDAWIAMHRVAAGRKYMIAGSVGHAMRSPANPGQILQQIRPQQSGVFSDALEVAR